MSKSIDPEMDVSQPTLYEIRLKGHLGKEWIEWFEGMAITLDDSGETVLTGPIADQSALHGLLKKIRDLGMPLLSVTCVETGSLLSPAKKQKALKD